MKVKDLTAAVVTTGVVKGGLDNAKIYVDGAQVGSTKDLTDTAYDGTGEDIATWGFGSSFVVKAGTTAKVQVLADIKTATSTSFSGNETIHVRLSTTASGVQKMSSLGYQDAIGAVWGTADTLSVSAAGLTVSKYSGYGNQTVIAGATNVKMGSFVITAGSSEGVSMSSITVTLGTYEASTITNMYLKDNATGAIIGSAKNIPGTSNIYSLSPNLTLAANGSKTINIYADVKSDAAAQTWIANIDADGSGIVTGNSVSADALDIQTMTVASAGTLTATNGSMPDAAIVLAGSTGNYMAQYTFSAVNEGFVIDELKLKTANNFATSTNSVTVKYTDKAGVAQQASASFVTLAATDVNATATFTGLSIYVPANSDTSIGIYVDMATLTSSGATHSGQTGTIILDYNEGFSATGDSGTPLTSVGSSDLTSNAFYNRKSKPTFAKLDAGTDPVNGPLYRFSVVADSAGNIEIKQLGFTIATTACDVTSLYLYDTSASLALTDTTARPITAVEGAAVAVIVGGTVPLDNDVIIVGTTAKTYELRGAVTGYSAAGDQIVVSFKQDIAALANTTAYLAGADGTDAGANGGVDRFNVWSDRSASAHTTATLDWTNGYLLKDMTQSQSFSK